MSYISRILLIIIFIFSSCFVFSQTKIRGYIYNSETSEPVPFANLVFFGTSFGCTSDENGEFYLESNTKDPRLIISCLGFQNDTIIIELNKFQDFMVYLSPDPYSLDEVLIKAGEDPVIPFMKNVQKNKEFNNYNRLDAYSYEQYTKMQVDINNFNSNIKNRVFLKDFELAFKGLDTSAVSGKTYMPLVLMETLSDFYFQKFPPHKKEVIKAVNVSGVDNPSFTQLTGQMYVDFNFYANFITVLDKQFVSPISTTGLLTYNYFITDTATIDNSWCYHLVYKPKRKYEYTFKGDMWIADTSFALKSISAQMSETANLSYITDLYVKHEYKRIGDFYFPENEEFLIDFNVTNFTAGFFGRKNSYRKNIDLDPKFNPSLFSKTDVREIETEEHASDFDSTQWNAIRFKELTEKEAAIYDMVDSVKKTRGYKILEKTVYLLGTGYYSRKYFEYGPYYKLWSRNAIEEYRFRFGIRTSNNLSKTIELNGYMAYGTKDSKVKFGSGLLWKIKKEPWTLAQIKYYEDLIQLGANLSNYGTDNIFVLNGSNDKLLFIKNIEFDIERDILKSLSGTLSFAHKEIFPTDFITFQNDIDTFPRISASEVNLKTRFALNEQYIAAIFHRQSLGSFYPIVEFTYTQGISTVFDTPYPYQKYTLGLKYYFNLRFAGKIRYYVEAGLINGKLPFPLLQLHEGMMRIVYDEYAFNLMNFYEFASDKYLSFFGEYHLNGLFLNRVPLLRQLRMREVFYLKGVWGSLRENDHQSIMIFPVYAMNELTRPYIETGIGVENIFNFFSVNYFRRITHLKYPVKFVPGIPPPKIRKNGIIIGFKFNF